MPRPGRLLELAVTRPRAHRPAAARARRPGSTCSPARPARARACSSTRSGSRSGARADSTLVRHGAESARVEALFDRVPEPLIAVREVSAGGRSLAAARRRDGDGRAARPGDRAAGRDPRPARPAAAARRGLAARPARRVRRARRRAGGRRRRPWSVAREPGRARGARDRSAGAAAPPGAAGARGGRDRRGPACARRGGRDHRASSPRPSTRETIATGRGRRPRRRCSGEGRGARGSGSRAAEAGAAGARAARRPVGGARGPAGRARGGGGGRRGRGRGRSPRPSTTTRRRSRRSRSGWARSTGCCAATATTRRRSSRTASGPRRRRRGCAASRTSAPGGPPRTRGLLLAVADAAASLSLLRAGTASELGGAASVGARGARVPGRRVRRWRSGAGRRPATTPRSRSTATRSRSTRPGIDTVVFTFRPNPGEPARPLARIASGGELSRVALAVKQVLAEVDATPDARVRRDRHRHRRAERGPGRAQPVDARPRAPGAVRDAPAADRRLRRRPLPDREARARRPDRDRDHAARPRGARARSWPR